MQVDILTPEQELFSGEAQGVQLPGTEGKFEILDDHAPLISSLQQGQVNVRTKDNTHEYAIRGGFVEVLDNQVSVLIEAQPEEKEGETDSDSK